MHQKITLIQGHPDPKGRHFGHALADSYVRGALAEGHEIKVIEIAQIDFPLLRSQAEWNDGTTPPSLREAQAAIAWADHLVVIFPLWLGTMPAVLKGFLEQVLRPGFALEHKSGDRFPEKRLQGKSARVVAPMGMPAIWYRWFFRAHCVRGLERNILGFCGISPVRETLIGLVEAKSPAARQKWLDRLEALGRKGG